MDRPSGAYARTSHPNIGNGNRRREFQSSDPDEKERQSCSHHQRNVRRANPIHTTSLSVAAIFYSLFCARNKICLPAASLVFWFLFLVGRDPAVAVQSRKHDSLCLRFTQILSNSHTVRRRVPDASFPGRVRRLRCANVGRYSVCSVGG